MEIRGVSKEKHHFLPFSCKVLLNFSLKSDVRSGVQGSLFAINVGLLGVVLHCGKHEGCKRRVLLDVVWRLIMTWRLKKIPYSSCKEEKLKKTQNKTKTKKQTQTNRDPKKETKKHKNKKRTVWCSFLDKWVISPNNIKYIIMWKREEEEEKFTVSLKFLIHNKKASIIFSWP